MSVATGGGTAGTGSFRNRHSGGGSGTGGAGGFKEKVVQMYEVLLRGDDPSLHPSFGSNFWSDFFLLKPKTSHFEAETAKLTPEQLINARPNLNR